jgi:hypothetical protein
MPKFNNKVIQNNNKRHSFQNAFIREIALIIYFDLTLPGICPMQLPLKESEAEAP